MNSKTKNSRHIDSESAIGILKKLSSITKNHSDHIEILKNITDLLGSTLSLTRCSFLAIENDKLAYVISAYEPDVTKNLRIYIDKYPEIQRMIHFKEIVQIKSILTDPLLKPHRNDHREDIDYSTMAVPVIYGSQLRGLLFIKADLNGEGFNESEVEVCEIAATIAFKALKQACFDAFVNQDALKEKKSYLNDGITGLYNSAYFHSRLEEMYNEAMRYEYPFTLVLIDLDNYKEIYHRKGRDVGEAIMGDVARLLTNSARQTDLFFKTAESEFAVLMPHSSLEGVKEKAQRIKDSIEIHAFGGIIDKITATIALGQYPMEGIFSYTDLYDITQKTAYESLKTSSNQIVIVPSPK